MIFGITSIKLQSELKRYQSVMWKLPDWPETTITITGSSLCECGHTVYRDKVVSQLRCTPASESRVPGNISRSIDKEKQFRFFLTLDYHFPQRPCSHLAQIPSQVSRSQVDGRNIYMHSCLHTWHCPFASIDHSGLDFMHHICWRKGRSDYSRSVFHYIGFQEETCCESTFHVPVQVLSNLSSAASASEAHEWAGDQMKKEALEEKQLYSNSGELYRFTRFPNKLTMITETQGKGAGDQGILRFCLESTEMLLCLHYKWYVVVHIPNHLRMWFEGSDHKGSGRHMGPSSHLCLALA